MNHTRGQYHFFQVFSTGLSFKLIILAVILSMLPFSMAQAEGPSEVYEVQFELKFGPADWILGVVDPDASVEVKKGVTVLFEVTADSSGNWECPFPVEINPGNWFTVTAGAGLNPVDIEIPDPFTAEASSATDKVWGQIDHLHTEPVEVHGNWDSGYQEVTTDEDGFFDAAYSFDIPNGGDGYVTYHTMRNYADVYFHQYFRTLDLILEVNYGYDWVQGRYEPGHIVSVTLYESDKSTVKATASMDTGVTPWWGGQTGFSTDIGDPWVPKRPDIQPGDWVYGQVDNGYEAWVRIGMITGDVDVDNDKVTGNVNAGWLSQTNAVNLTCHLWEESAPDNKDDTVLPNGVDPYECDWSGEWDIQTGQRVQVAYFDPAGHEIRKDFYDPYLIFLPLIMR